MNIELWSLLFLAFSLGMLHALDADHIIAVTSLSSMRQDSDDNEQAGNKKFNRKQSLIFCSRWALGHGAALMVIGTAVLFLGMAIPEHLSQLAESMVGVVLVLLGAYVLWDMRRKNAHLHFHQHDGVQNHAHWHSHQKARHSSTKATHQHSHAPVFVGVLHGTAGSAPLLALLPLAQMSSPWIGFGYLIMFGVGVFLSMLLFGGVLGHVFSRMQKWGDRFINGLRVVVSLVSIGYGVNLLMAAT